MEAVFKHQGTKTQRKKKCEKTGGKKLLRPGATDCDWVRPGATSGIAVAPQSHLGRSGCRTNVAVGFALGFFAPWPVFVISIVIA
jgi:hypothetical protein